MTLLKDAIKECGMGMGMGQGRGGMGPTKGMDQEMGGKRNELSPNSLLTFLVRRNQAENEEDSDEGSEEVSPEENQEADTVTMDVPLLIRMMELSREEIKDDATLHHVAKKMIDLGAEGKTLDMNHYEEIIANLDLAKHDDEEERPEEMG